MNTTIANFFKKNYIRPNDIKYILRENNKTNIYTLDGRIISTYHPLKEFRIALPVEDFLAPNKGILAAASQIVNINNGYYEMADGRSFKYRVHNSKYHDTRLLMLGRNLEKTLSHTDASSEDTLFTQFSVMDKMPLAVSVIEFVPEEFGAGANFVFRYCNQYMADFEQLSKEKIIGSSVSSLFPNADKKWLVVYADVALNDSVRTIEEFNEERGVWVHVYCYQPMPGYCACALIPIKTDKKPDWFGEDVKVGFM